MKTERLDVLMVEDDSEQAALILDTARLCRTEIKWEVVSDGESALAFVRRRGLFADRPRPGLMLLDLHLPGIDGVEVLRCVKTDLHLRSLPVIIMSTSRDQADIEATYALGANCYIAKPGSFEGLCSLVRFIDAFLTLPIRQDPPAASPSPGPTAAHIN